MKFKNCMSCCGGALLSVLLASAASADFVDYTLDFEYSGAAKSQGTLKIRFDDTGLTDMVNVTVDGSLLDSDNFVSVLAFNIDPYQDLTITPTVAASASISGFSTSKDGLDADGSKKWDGRVDFATNGSDRLTGGLGVGGYTAFQFKLSGAMGSGFDITHLDALSTGAGNDGPYGGFKVAAHIQGIDATQCTNPDEGNACTSGWMTVGDGGGGPPTAIPLPAAAWMFLGGVGLFGWIRRKAGGKTGASST